MDVIVNVTLFWLNRETSNPTLWGCWGAFIPALQFAMIAAIITVIATIRIVAIMGDTASISSIIFRSFIIIIMTMMIFVINLSIMYIIIMIVSQSLLSSGIILDYVKHGFLCDDKAISSVIGFALILAIIVSTLGYVQTYFVPVWNAEAESEHFENVYQDLVLFSSNLESAAISGIPRTSGIRLGLTYPKRGIFFNPKSDLFGNLVIEPNVYTNISYTTNTDENYMKSYRSSTLKYELPGAHPYIVYEHGLVIRDFSRFGRPNATTSSNTLIVGDNINIPFLLLSNSRFSTVSVQPAILPIYPVELTNKTDIVEYIKYVNITMDTNYPDVWGQILRNANTSKTTAYVSNTSNGYKIIINTTAGVEMDLPDETKQVTQAGRLYAGMAVVKATGELTSLKGSGGEILNQGTVWNDILIPSEVSTIILTNITCIDQTLLRNDMIDFKVTDQSNDYWEVQIGFDYASPTSKIKSIKLISAHGTSTAKKSYFDSFNNFDGNSIIDLFNINTTNFDKTDGAYNNSGILQPNTLTSILVGDKNGPYDSNDNPQSALVNYRLIIE